MAKRLPKKARFTELPEHWRSTRRFLPVGFRWTPVSATSGQHRIGGPTRHRGAKCTLCRRSLTLLCEVSLADPLLSGILRGAFAPLGQLPLYACLQCPSPTCYKVVSDTAIRCFPQPRCGSEENPLAVVPGELCRQSVRIEPIPSVVDGLLSLADEVGYERLDVEAKRLLRRWYGRRIGGEWDLPFSQFGGGPLFCQGHREIPCPNPRCPASRVQPPYDWAKRPLLMKELAVVASDSAEELRAACAQVAYHACCICLAVQAQYRCS